MQWRDISVAWYWDQFDPLIWKSQKTWKIMNLKKVPVIVRSRGNSRKQFFVRNTSVPWNSVHFVRHVFGISETCKSRKDPNVCRRRHWTTAMQCWAQTFTEQFSDPGTATGHSCVCPGDNFELNDLCPRHLARWFTLTLTGSYSKVKDIGQGKHKIFLCKYQLLTYGNFRYFCAAVAFCKSFANYGKNVF